MPDLGGTGMTLARALDRLGPAGRRLGVTADLVRSAGPRATAARWQDEARARRGDAAAHELGYPVLWRRAAAQVGADVRDLGSDFLAIARGERRTVVWNHWVPLDSAVTLRLALDKGIVTGMLRDAGLPITDQLEYRLRRPQPAIEFVRRAGGDCVVKPAEASGGSGATCGVRTVGELARASLRAARLEPRLLIERQVPGDVYRLLYLDGRLLDVVRRTAPRVTGDGTSTVGELIQRQNRETSAAGGRPGASLLRIDLDCVLTLAHAGLTLGSVPKSGTVVPVKAAVSQNAPGDNHTVREPLHPELAGQAERAVELTGLRLAGVDLITTDPRIPLRESGGAIVEVNGTPGLIYHYRVSEPEAATDVAVPILRTLLGDG
jgi:D-alanine-D-alanine ligase-like ATP-grasp enzyme